MKKEKELKLIYINKIGYNSKDEGMYEFIFSDDPESVDAEAWGWTKIPASSNAEVPSEDAISEVYTLKTNLFDLICLHDCDDRPYMHGYHSIHALAYEDEDYQGDPEYNALYGNMPLLVFHYGMTTEQVKDLLYERDVILKGNDFVATKSKQKSKKQIDKIVEKVKEELENEDTKQSSDEDFFQIKF